MHFERFAIEDGLSQSSIMSIHEDKSGFLWFGTRDGLNRYDGYEFKVFRHDPEDTGSISGNHIGALYEDRNGTLWIGTDAGLNKYDNETHSFNRMRYQKDNPNSLSGDSVSFIREDASGLLWIGTRNSGLNRFDPITQQFTHFRHDDSDSTTLNDDRVTAMHVDSDGFVWVGTPSGLNKYDAQGNGFEHYRHQSSNPFSLSSNNVTAIHEDGEGAIWVGTADNGLNRFVKQTERFIHFRNDPAISGSLGSNSIRLIYRDSQEDLWVGTANGLSRYLPVKGQFVHYQHEESDPYSLSRNSIWSVYESSQQTLWVGTSGGLNKYDTQTRRFVHFKPQASDANSLSDKFVSAILEDDKGILWVATFGGGLNRYDEKTQQFKHFKHDERDPGSLSSDSISSFYQDSNGLLWVGTGGGGLDRYDAITERFIHFTHDENNPASISSDEVWSIHEDKEGILWIGTSKGVDKFDVSTLSFENYSHDPSDPQSLSHDIVVSISSAKGVVWFGTTGGGLNRYDKKTNQFKNFRHDAKDSRSLSSDTVKSVYISTDGVLWVSTISGLNRLDAKTHQFTRYQQKDGLENELVYGMLEDDKGYLWLSTNMGIFKFNPVSSAFQRFDVKDGLQSNEFNTGSYYRSKRGEFFFGGVNGFNRFFPENVTDDKQTPKVVFTDFLLFNKSVPIHTATDTQRRLNFGLSKAIGELEKITLTHKQNLMSFQFAALHFSVPMKNQYAYRLEGWDDDWIFTDARIRRATYTNIPAGEYTLRVKASNKDGYWNEQGKSLRIEVLPPPWGTWWAYSSYGLLFVALVLSFVRAQRKKIEYERAVNLQLKKVDKLKDEFLANTSHELRTPLNGIIGLAESLIDGVTGELPESTNANLAMVVASGKRLANLINDILDFSKLKNANLQLNPTAVELHALTDVVLTLSRPLLGDKDLVLNNAVPNDLHGAHADEDRLQQILHNLVGNAIKFTDRGEVTVSAIEEDGELRISVTDSGIGIAKDQFDTIFKFFEQVQGSTDRAYSGTGLGLAVSKQLVELHGGRLEVESQMGHGSTFSFTLPVSDEVAEKEVCVNQSVARLPVVPVTIECEQLVNLPTDSNGFQFKILLVDDEPINRQVLLNHLSLQNYHLVEAAGGQEALDIVAQSEPFDLILLDIMMPRISGYEVCKKLRETYPVNDLPVIFLTAKNQVADLVQSFAVGANDYLSKPVAKHELLTRVETHLRLLDINRNLESKVVERTTELEKSAQSIMALSEICSEISSTLDLNKLLNTVYFRIKQLMDVDVFSIGLYEQSSSQIVFKLAIECDERLPQFAVSMADKSRPAVWCVDQQQAMIMNNFGEDYPRYFGDMPIPQPKEGKQTGSLVYWPLIVGEQIIGVLTVQSFQLDAYSEDKQDMIRTLASTTAIALDNANAYREVEEKNRALMATQQQLVQSEKMASLGTLTAGVAHEINNPTNFVHVSAQNLEVDLQRTEQFIVDLAGDDTDEEILESLGQQFKPLYDHLFTIKDGTQRIKSIVRDLHAFTQLEIADPKKVNIIECLNSTINLVQTKHLEITEFVTEFDAKPDLVCHPGQLNQVFMNLIVNACDAIRDKKRLQGDSDAGKIVIGCKTLDKSVEITVKDNGCGMSEETKNKLFEPFYTTKPVGEGTGLGLSISYGIVQKHHGELTVESKLGEGTLFRLTLPR